MLETNRLVIRPARLRDAKALFDVYGDAETMRYWSSLPDQTLAETKARVDSMRHATSYFVFELEDRAIGAGGVHQDNEIGYILNRTHWGKGLMREALVALIPWLFDQLALAEITADVDPNNAASIRLLTSLGFVETGRKADTIKIGDTWFDSVYFALSRRDFVASQLPTKTLG